LCVGLFADGSYGAGWNLTESATTAEQGVTGLLYDVSLGSSQLVAQAVGVAVICTVMFGIVLTFFKIQNVLTKGGIRPEPAVELAGLDVAEMGAIAYPEFQGSHIELDGNGNGDGVTTPARTPVGIQS
jgi:Amt family ammonium transporter